MPFGVVNGSSIREYGLVYVNREVKFMLFCLFVAVVLFGCYIMRRITVEAEP